MGTKRIISKMPVLCTSSLMSQMVYFEEPTQWIGGFPWRVHALQNDTVVASYEVYYKLDNSKLIKLEGNRRVVGVSPNFFYIVDLTDGDTVWLFIHIHRPSKDSIASMRKEMKIAVCVDSTEWGYVRKLYAGKHNSLSVISEEKCRRNGIFFSCFTGDSTMPFLSVVEGVSGGFLRWRERRFHATGELLKDTFLYTKEGLIAGIIRIASFADTVEWYEVVYEQGEEGGPPTIREIIIKKRGIIQRKTGFVYRNGYEMPYAIIDYDVFKGEMHIYRKAE